MIEKPKRPKKIPNQDNKQPQTIQELIRRYDLDNTKIYDFLDELVGSLNKKDTYSTEEQVIGTWVDGKTLYRRVFETGALPNAAIISSATDLSVTNTIVRVECYAKNDSVFVPLSYASRSGSDNVSFNVSINSDTNCYQLTFGTASDKRTWTGYVIIEYTKATD